MPNTPPRGRSVVSAGRQPTSPATTAPRSSRSACAQPAPCWPARANPPPDAAYLHHCCSIADRRTATCRNVPASRHPRRSTRRRAPPARRVRRTSHCPFSRCRQPRGASTPDLHCPRRGRRADRFLSHPTCAATWRNPPCSAPAPRLNWSCRAGRMPAPTACSCPTPRTARCGYGNYPFGYGN